MTAQIGKGIERQPLTVYSSLISNRVSPITLKLLFTASLFDARHYGDIGKNKPVGLIAVQLGKALNGFPYL